MAAEEHTRTTGTIGQRHWDVVVVGAGLSGLSGLTAATVAAQAGAAVALVEAHRTGGRAAVTDVGGALLNGGPRAWFPGGPGAAELAALGVRPRGRSKVTGRIALAEGGRLHTAAGAAAAAAAAAVLRHVRAAGGQELARTPASDWVASTGGRPDLVAAATRLVTYADDLDALSADAVVGQLRVASRGVRYLDGGFGAVVDGLRAAADRAGVVQVSGAATGTAPVGEHAHQVSVDGAALRCRSVVVAVGSPAAARALLGDPDAWPGLGPPATAACLEVVLRRRPRWRFVLGVDEPLYLSEHSPPARLGPPGTVVVHALRYGTTTAAADRERLRRLVVDAGVAPDDVVHERFLRRMVVTPAVPTPAGGGLAGRPGVEGRSRPGVLLAGDWVGPVGLLADAAISSGAAAGRVATRALRAGGPARLAGSRP